MYSAPLAAKERYDPDLISGFMVAQQKSFKQLFGESTSVLTLQKRQILLQSVNLKDRSLLIAIAHELGNPKEEKFSKAILEGLITTLKNKKDKILREPPSAVTETVRRELDKIVSRTLEDIPCLYFVKGVFLSRSRCERTNSLTEGRPCDFNYAVKECDRYNAKES